jgi:hypothetical protein
MVVALLALFIATAGTRLRRDQASCEQRRDEAVLKTVSDYENVH